MGSSAANSFKQWWKGVRRTINPPLVAYLGQAVLWLIYKSCRIEVKGLSDFISTVKREKTILMLWHDRILLTPYTLFNYTSTFPCTAVISNSRDGEILSAVTHTYKRGRVVLVARNAKHQALREIVSRLQNEEVLIMTPDGPQGPSYAVKPGIAFAAKSAEATIIPFSWTATKFWHLNTWDNMILPQPFSKITITFGAPLSPIQHQHLSVEETTILLQEALDAIG